MAEHPNAELVRKGYDAFIAGDIEWMNEHLHDNGGRKRHLCVQAHAGCYAESGDDRFVVALWNRPSPRHVRRPGSHAASDQHRERGR